MNLFERFLYLLKTNMSFVPGNYSLFHIVFILFIAIITTLLCVFFKDATKKQFKTIVLISWLIILILEIFKQLIYSFNYDPVTNEKSWSYYWNFFPYQLCSSALYVLPLIFFVKNEKIEDCLMAFMSLFSFFGGLAVMLYPNDVFNGVTYINHQTMIHHGIQVCMGIYMFVYNRRKVNILYFLKALPVFAVMAVLAFIFNETLILIPNIGVFNMWFISRHFASTLPVLSMIYPLVPYWLFVIIYFIGFAIVAFIINSAAVGIKKLGSLKK